MFEVDAALIRKLIFSQRLSLRRLSKATGLNERTVKRLFDGKKCSLKSIAVVADYFGVSPEDLITSKNFAS